MSRIVYINPAYAKQARRNGLESELAMEVLGRYCSFMPNISAGVFAALTPPRHEFVFVDEEIEDILYDELGADLVGITAMTVNANRAYRIAGEFRRLGVPVVIGGAHASVRSEEAAEHCDSVVVGEGESIWPVLLGDFERGELKKFYRAQDYPPVTEFVRPDYSVYKAERYFTFPIYATRGCPHSCGFCSIKHVSGHRYRMRPVADVVGDIMAAERHNSSRSVLEKKSYFFVDDNLYVNREYTKELFSAMAGLGIAWDGQGTVNTASDDEVLGLMAASGCRSLSFGFESVSDAALAGANKPKINSVGGYADAIRNIQRHGISAGGFFIVGFDEDDVGVFQKTLDFIDEAGLLQPMLSILTPYPGTELEGRLAGEGRIHSRSWEKYNCWSCVFTPRKMSADELQAGFYWLSIQLTRLGRAKKSIEAFWESEAWAGKPRLRPMERVFLAAIALTKMRGRKRRHYRDFLLWAAFHPKARDVRFISWLVLRNEFAGLIEGEHEDPARARERRAESGGNAERAKRAGSVGSGVSAESVGDAKIAESGGMRRARKEREA